MARPHSNGPQGVDEIIHDLTRGTECHIPRSERGLSAARNKREYRRNRKEQAEEEERLETIRKALARFQASS